MIGTNRARVREAVLKVWPYVELTTYLLPAGSRGRTARTGLPQYFRTFPATRYTTSAPLEEYMVYARPHGRTAYAAHQRASVRASPSSNPNPNPYSYRSTAHPPPFAPSSTHAGSRASQGRTPALHLHSYPPRPCRGSTHSILRRAPSRLRGRPRVRGRRNRTRTSRAARRRTRVRPFLQPARRVRK